MKMYHATNIENLSLRQVIRMDRKEAIERIQEVMTIIRTQHMCKDMDGECTTEDRETYMQRFEALRMAIEALQEPQVGDWIPVSERLPEERQDRYYPISLVTLDNEDVCLGVYRYDDKEWWTRMSEGETVYTTDHKVTAWQPLPEPYKESEEE